MIKFKLKSDPSSTSLIDLKQIDFLETWLEILKNLFNPFAENFFMGFSKSRFNSINSYIQRSRPNEHEHARPHDDKSIMVFRVALNSYNDYESGGIRFIRYNCSVNKLRKGWALVFPSVITHYFENMAVSEGVSYSLLSYIDS